jgi:hypothetical protein
MSEFSTSYHIRLGEGPDVQKVLRQAKVSGVVFGPANGWLTFVPYPKSVMYRGEARFADYLSKLTRRPVLYYFYAEDHGWSFALAHTERSLVQFACWWDPHPAVELDQYDPLALAPLVTSDLLEPLLRSLDREEAVREEPAYRFAKLLGLPAYRWLSPELAQERTQDLLEQGGRKLGTKPASVAKRLRLPPDRQIALPQPYLSAREALDLIVPFMAQFKAPWSLTMLSTYGFRLPDGRGIWQARWRYGDSGDMVEAVLMEDGRLSFRGSSAPSYETDDLMKVMRLPETWLDSTDIAAIMASLPVPFGLTPSSLGSMTLRSFIDHPHIWEVLTPGDRNGVEPFASWVVHLDAASGEVLGEQLGRRFGHEIVPVRQRVKNGDWLDLNYRNR